MNKSKDHQPKSEKSIFVGYAIDQPLCYKVFISGPPSSVKISTHVRFLDINFNSQDLLQEDLCTSLPTLSSPPKHLSPPRASWSESIDVLPPMDLSPPKHLSPPRTSWSDNIVDSSEAQILFSSPMHLTAPQASWNESLDASHVIVSLRSPSNASSGEDVGGIELLTGLELQSSDPVDIPFSNITSESDKLTGEAHSDLIGKDFRDDEDALIYHMLTISEVHRFDYFYLFGLLLAIRSYKRHFGIKC